MKLTRRGFLSRSAALAAAPLCGVARAAPSPPRAADIVVIGAGAAGIAAARRIMAVGRKVIVIEADSQIGGRCATDLESFPAPFDRGARQLHNPETNPLLKLGRGAGLDVAPASFGQKLRVGRRFARAGETEEYLAALVRANRAIDDAARGKVDVSCAAAMPKDLGEWADTVELTLGAGAVGKDLKDVSAMDRSKVQDRNAILICRQGLGTLMGKLGDGLPVSLSTPVLRVIWSNRDVAVETGSGKLLARAAIVTVSTNVLARGAIKFVPELPSRYLDAAAKLSLGSYDRIALQMAGNPLGLARDEMLIEQSSSTKTALLSANIGGSSLCVVDVGGSFGRDLATQGERAMTAFAAEWIAKMFGSEASGAIKRTSATRWDAAPFVRGAMSAAEPGGQPARKVLIDPVGSLFLAGEATHETLWGTVDGAWESGERAANAALHKIGALEEEPAEAPDAPEKPVRRGRRRR